jgi:hypothetical protein
MKDIICNKTASSSLYFFSWWKIHLPQRHYCREVKPRGKENEGIMKRVTKIKPKKDFNIILRSYIISTRQFQII